MNLGKWAVIDIETTGIDPSYDQIIDLGYLQFENSTLVKKYSSLVKTDRELNQFIQNLTGITPAMVSKAPSWKKVKIDLWDLEGSALIAHNAHFESSFLQSEFKEQEVFSDSLYFCALLFPELNSLSLENIILYLQIAEGEKHRGFEDSLDLLKVMLLGLYRLQQNPNEYVFLKSLIHNFDDSFWFKHFFQLNSDEILHIASQIDFDLIFYFDNFKKTVKAEKKESFLKWDILDFSSQSIKNIFENEEKIKSINPGYSFRESQQSMALRVGQAFKNNLHAIIQAPTGTGKTLGYLIPAFLLAKESADKKILLATATKVLQEQAYQKDIPQVKAILGRDFSDIKTSYLVGSANHYCELLFQEMKDDSFLKTFDEVFFEIYFEYLFFQNKYLTQDQKRIRLSVPGILKRIVENFEYKEKEIAVDFKNCAGVKCQHFENCSYTQGIAIAKEAHIIVGNHALMYHWPRGVERPNYLIIDEAHRLEDETTGAFTKELLESDFVKMIGNLDMGQPMGSLLFLLDSASLEIKNQIRLNAKSFAAKLKDQTDSLTLLIEAFFKKTQKYTSEYWNEIPMIDESKQNDELTVSILNKLKNIKVLLSDCVGELEKYESFFDKNTTVPNEVVALTHYEVFSEQLKLSLEIFTSLFDDAATFSKSIGYHEAKGFLFKIEPIDVGSFVYEEVLLKAESTVMTSATLVGNGGIGGAGVYWMTGHNSLDKEKRFSQILSLPPVFDYQNKAKVFLSHDLPGMNQIEFVPELLNKVLPLVRELDGKTLFLFSSKMRFEIAREILLEKISATIPVFSQGLGIKAVDDFKKASKGILIGMESFGEGIDIPGDKLQLVIIDKIPDVRFDLVTQKRRDFYESHFGNEFIDYFMSIRARKLLQKLGRLLRTNTDYGCAIVVDARLKSWKGRTMAQLKDLLSPYHAEILPIDKSIEETRKFLLEDKK